MTHVLAIILLFNTSPKLTATPLFFNGFTDVQSCEQARQMFHPPAELLSTADGYLSYCLPILGLDTQDSGV